MHREIYRGRLEGGVQAVGCVKGRSWGGIGRSVEGAAEEGVGVAGGQGERTGVLDL